MGDTTERARLIQYAEGIVHAAIYGPEMGWTHPEEEAQGKREAIEVVRALAAELAAAEKRNAELEELLRAACDALHEIRAKPYRAEEVVMRWFYEPAAAASEGKP